MSAHLRSVWTAVPRLPGEVARASAVLMAELKERGLAGTVLLLIGFIALGYGTERLFWRATASLGPGSGAARSTPWPSACS